MHNNEQDNNETCYNYLTNMRSTLGQNRVIEKASISYKKHYGRYFNHCYFSCIFVFWYGLA
ncbi:MAG: hypothetical protein ACJA1X_002198 [Bermanella sp.]|jgi:hypothetical protein